MFPNTNTLMQSALRMAMQTVMRIAMLSTCSYSFSEGVGAVEGPPLGEGGLSTSK
jgi:hypothetical protein